MSFYLHDIILFSSIEQNKHIHYHDYKKDGDQRKDEECAICFNSFIDSDKLKVLTCPGHHSFHVKCIDNWLLRVYRCPCCNFDLDFK